MGKVLKSYFDKAKEINGIQGQVKLAMITKMSGVQAMKAEDSDENIKLFEDALNQIQ